jgi:DNA replication protein DnaC
MMRPVNEIQPNILRRASSDAEVYRPAETPVCPKCQGAGWLRLDVPLGHPSFGRLFRCECQQRTEDRARVTEMRRLSQLDGLEGKSFAAFEADTADLTRALETARAYAQSLSGWLVLSGRCGTGKTHLAAAIANETLEKGDQTVMFAVVPDLLDHLRATFDPARGVDYDERFQAIRNTFLLVLDDLGTENATPWAREKLYQIVNHRYNERLPTVITTNQAPSAIDERILSRMLDSTLSKRIQLDGEDFRRRGDPTYFRGSRGRPGTTTPRRRA